MPKQVLNKPVMSIRLDPSASPRTDEGKAYRIVQTRLKRGQTASEILLEALLRLENIPSPRESWMDEIKETIQQSITDSLASIQIMGGASPQTKAEAASQITSSAITRLMKLAHLTGDEDDE